MDDGYLAGGQRTSLLRSGMGGFLGGMAAISTILCTDGLSSLPSQIPLQVYIDNTALITRITQWKFLGPSDTLQTGHDPLLQVSMQIAASLFVIG